MQALARGFHPGARRFNVEFFRDSPESFPVPDAAPIVSFAPGCISSKRSRVNVPKSLLASFGTSVCKAQPRFKHPAGRTGLAPVMWQRFSRRDFPLANPRDSDETQPHQ